jgi:DNA replication and repair protein RecF
LRIQRLHLRNFRNLEDVGVEFGPSRNLIVGANAQGKTNLLEAIHILGVGRSHRDRKDANLVRFGESYYRVEGIFDHIGVRTVVEVAYGDERKRVRINGKEARPADLIGLVAVVISSPDDIDLVKGSPSYRRTFLDMALSQMSRDYLSNLQHYVRSLAQRNRLLKRAQEGSLNRAETAAWDQRLIEAGARVVRARIGYLADICPTVENNFARISGNRSTIELIYDPRGYKLDKDTDVETELARALAATREVEIARGHTMSGPHVDDFKFLSDGRDIRQFGSEGEQRTAVLALRCAEVHAINTGTGRYPIVLLDDVFAELDEARSRALTALISDFDQIILTSSRPASLEDEDMRRITVNAGRIN